MLCMRSRALKFLFGVEMHFWAKTRFLGQKGILVILQNRIISHQKKSLCKFREIYLRQNVFGHVYVCACMHCAPKNSNSKKASKRNILQKFQDEIFMIFLVMVIS